MPRLDNVFLKLNRASTRSAELSANVAAFCHNHPITLDAQLREGRLGVNLVCQMEGMIAPLKEWSLELGEIVYSLRSALDNLIYVCAQIRTDPPPNPRSLQFPIAQHPGQYVNAARNIAPQLPPEIADLLEKIQPYHRDRPDVEGSPEHDPLVLLNWISNHDKHRMPIPFLIPPNEISFSHLCKFASEADASANIPPDIVIHLRPLSHGSILLEHRTKHPIKEVSGQLNMTAHVAFETHTGTRELSGTISQLTSYTKRVVIEFEKRIAQPG